MEQSPGYIDLQCPNHVCQLKKAGLNKPLCILESICTRVPITIRRYSRHSASRNVRILDTAFHGTGHARRRPSRRADTARRRGAAAKAEDEGGGRPQHEAHDEGADQAVTPVKPDGETQIGIPHPVEELPA